MQQYQYVYMSKKIAEDEDPVHACVLISTLAYQSVH